MKDKNKPDKGLDKQEQALWDAYIKDIENGGKLALEAPPLEDFAALLAEESLPFKDASLKKSEKPEVDNALKIEKRVKAVKSAPQLDRRTDEKLRRGKLTIDGWLDLHGMTQDEAHQALIRYIDQSILSGRRCILVITGKGKSNATSEDWLLPGQGILKQRVPEWLASTPVCSNILKTYTAQPHHGGSGALYVYLRRQR